MIFDGFFGIDWSGDKSKFQKGIKVAYLDKKNTPLEGYGYCYTGCVCKNFVSFSSFTGLSDQFKRAKFWRRL